MSACLIVDGDNIQRWQATALQHAVRSGLRIACVYVCVNTRVPRRVVKHAGYYAMRVTSMRTSWSRQVPWQPLVDHRVPVRHFESEWKGNWQVVSQDVRDEMFGFGFDVIIKYGMNLLRDPDLLPAAYGVLSFHHGDPASYRGRPAGFYEVLHDASHVGTIVQRIGNELDAGTIFAYGASRVVRHSYRRTLESTYGNSTYLLVKALRNVRDGVAIQRSVEGRAYSLPSNKTVVRFALKQLFRLLQRLVYGSVMRKDWRVGRTERLDPTTHGGTVSVREPDDYPTPPGFRFLADPCPGGDGSIWCEAVEARSGKGRILVLEAGQMPLLVDIPDTDSHHVAYPFVVEDADRRYLVPELSSVGPPRIFELDGTSILNSQLFLGLEDQRLVDPTLLRHGRRWWLFAGMPGSAADLLWLWSSESLRGSYEPHPDNPVVMDVARARPAGPIMAVDGRFYRPGQDNRRGYGDGVTVSEITCLTPERFEEEPRFEIRVAGRKGPHTLFLDGDSTVLDSYIERFDPTAWLGRIKHRL